MGGPSSWVVSGSAMVSGSADGVALDLGLGLLVHEHRRLSHALARVLSRGEHLVRELTDVLEQPLALLHRMRVSTTSCSE